MAKNDLEQYWNDARRKNVIAQSEEAIALLEEEYGKALQALAAWREKLNDNPDIPTLQTAGTIFYGGAAGVERSPLGGASLKQIDIIVKSL